MKYIFALIVILGILNSVGKPLHAQNIKQVYDIDQELVNKILQQKGEKIKGDFRYEKESDSTGKLYRLNDLSNKDIGIIIKADLSICTDGSNNEKFRPCPNNDNVCIDGTHGNETAFNINGKYFDAEKIQYIVLPGNKEPYPYKDWGFNGKEIGVIINTYKGKNKLIFAIFGEAGPNSIIGEASVYASTQLGFYPCKSEGAELVGIPYDVYYLIFTNSYLEDLNMESLNQKVTELGLQKMKENFNIEIK